MKINKYKMIPFKYFYTNNLKRHSNLLLSSLLRQVDLTTTFSLNIREKHKKGESKQNLFYPVSVKLESNELNIGAELTGALKKSEIVKILHEFSRNKSVVKLALEYGLDNTLIHSVLNAFRNYCSQSQTLPVDLHIILSDIIHGAGNITDIFPYFLRFAKQMYPHMDCMDDLKKISDLRDPANWYPTARFKLRKVIFHAGPTNSGKTYHALQRFISAKSGVYCGPLKLLAVEIFNKCNSMGTPCDLVTGEEKRFATNEMSPANHVSCSVEMVNVQNYYEVAILDEIQLLRDPTRGWAWTRALLGIAADELHLCGESSAIPIVESICATTGETVEVHKYNRLTPLIVEKNALSTFANVQDGDCIVCFNKNDIFTVSQTLEKRGHNVAVIYGSLPPGTKLMQAAKFNDVNHSCKILVATNAIGMGLNLHIRRIIFYSLLQPTVNQNGEKTVDTISVSSALQIAGRAGRYNTQWPEGYVTTFKPEDYPVLCNLLNETPETIKQAGIHPTADQIELYAYHLPNAPLSNLINIFISLCQVNDSLYFICNLDDFKYLADMIQHIPLPLRVRYVFCCAPIDKKAPLMCSMFIKFARQCSKNNKVTASWLCKEISWPLKVPRSINDLLHLETVFDVFDTYLWLSYRFMDLFPDANLVRQLQKTLDKIIEIGIQKVRMLFEKANAESQLREANVKGVRSFKKFSNTKLTDMLISQGRLTRKMLEQLQSEWSAEETANMEKSDYKNDSERDRFTRKPKN